MAVARRAVDLSRTLRGQAGLKMRQPLARLWLALPGRELAELDALLELVRVEANVKVVERIGDESELVDRGVKVLLPRVGKRLGARIPEVMAAAREGRFEIHADGTVTLAGETLAADEVEIQATPRPGTAVAHDDGLVAVIDTTLTPELLAEGDARELTARGPGPAQGGRAGPRRPDRAVGRRHRRRTWSRSSPPSPGRPSPTSCGARRRRPACRSRPSGSSGGEARIALRRAGEA